MIKVIIAEDKPPILWSIKQKVQEYGKTFVVVGEAYNGEQALTLINTHNPDVVFTDVRMPIMDGLELISHARKAHRDTHFVIISGYDEFEYARKAMKLGVFEYILKPVTQQSIDEVLEKIETEVTDRKLSKEKKLLQDLLNVGARPGTSSYNFKYSSYVPILMCAGCYSSHSLDFANACNYFWSNIDCTSLFSKHIPEGVFSWCFEGKNLNEMILLLGIPEGTSINIGTVMEALASDISVNNTSITLATCGEIYEVKNIGVEAHNVRMLIRKNLVFGKSAVLLNDCNLKNSLDKPAILDTSLEKKLIYYIQTRQKSSFFNEMSELLKYWEQSSYTQYNIENSLKYIFQVCCKSLLDSTDIFEDSSLEIEEILIMSRDYISLQNGIYSVFESLFPASADAKQKREPLKDTINDVERYITTNYSQQITINDIADMVKVDPCHLSKTFKNQKGLSPMEFLTNLRIEKAKDLILGDSSLMLKDIAEIVGYTNQYYFSRIFKMVTGVSPSEYKNENALKT